MHNASDAHLPPTGLPQARLMQMADALMWPLQVLRADALLPPSRQPEFDAALAAACQGNSVVLNWPVSEGSLGGAGSLSLLRSRRGTAPGSAEVLLALSATEHPDGQVQAYALLHRLRPAETRVLQRLALGESSGAGPGGQRGHGAQPGHPPAARDGAAQRHPAAARAGLHAARQPTGTTSRTR